MAVGGACGVGYSRTVVGLRDRGWSSVGSFGTVKAAEDAGVSGEAAELARAVVVPFNKCFSRVIRLEALTGREAAIGWGSVDN